MRCLTDTECATWLESISVHLERNGDLRFPREMAKIMSTVPNNTLMLHGFSRSLSAWWPESDKKIVGLTYWETCPPDQYVLFEKMRSGCGEFRHIIDAPGHVFDGLSHEDKALFPGVIFLILAFNWQGYVASESGCNFIYFGDEFLVFESDNVLKLDETSKLITDYKLKAITDVSEAWGRR